MGLFHRRHAKVAGPLALVAAVGGYVFTGFPNAHDMTVQRIMMEESFRSHIYTDSSGYQTIGYGTNVEIGITKREGEYLLRERLAGTYTRLTNDLPWVKDQPVMTQSALLDMSYQLGVDGTLKFHAMLTGLRAGDCAKAKAAALDSLWARETPQRARRVTDRLCAD